MQHRARLVQARDRGRCSIGYSIAGRIESDLAVSAVWRATFGRHPRFPEAIRLNASGNVERIRIYVDGEPVASSERGTGDRRVVLEVEKVVPPVADALPPDTLGRNRDRDETRAHAR